MATIIPAPSLSPSGWITNQREKADQLFSWTFVSQGLQSYLYRGSITSLQAIIQKYTNDIPTLCQQLQIAYENYFKRYYTNATVQVTSNANSTVNPTDVVALSIYVELTDVDGVAFSMGKMINTQNGLIQKILALNNTGSSA